MTRLLLTSVICVFLFGCKVSVETDKKKEDPSKQNINRICDAIMQAFRDENIDQVAAMMKNNSVLAGSVIDTLHAQMLDQVSLFNTYGKELSYELVQERTINEFAARRFYVLHFEKIFITYAFTVYKSAAGWKITHFKYDYDLSEYLFQ
jgi:hypothetical protein